MTRQVQQVDQRDLQGGILCGYGFEHALYIGVTVEHADSGCRWLRELHPRLTTALRWREKPDSTLNVSLSYPGILALGGDPRLLDSFPVEFRDGMAARAGELGDEGPSDPTLWEPWWDESRSHVLVTINARSDEALAVARDRLLSELDGEAGLTVAGEQETGGLPGAREHFGFADGFAQPAIADDHAGPWHGQGTLTERRAIRAAGRKRRAWDPLAPGEFIHGYRDEDWLESAGTPGRPLNRSGSYMVVRKLHQNVATFWNYMRDEAEGDEAAATRLAAKVVGRWPNGTPVSTHPDVPDPAIDHVIDPVERGRLLNDFGYADDLEGLRCPIGAHIRRVNPRDHFGDGRLTRRHRIIRRGMPYGDAPADRYSDDGTDRGLLFVSFQASIMRQFEFIQSRWCNDGDVFGLAADKDFLVSPGDLEGKMTINGHPPRFLHPQPTLVTTRGGGYYLTPGLTSLALLVGLI